MNVVALIPARGGSKELPRKNVLPVAGKPLIAWTIEDAKAARLVNRIIIMTDDEEIAAVARQHGAEVPFLLPAELTQDTSPMEPTLKYAVEWLEQHGQAADIVVYLQPTDFFRKPEWIDACVQKLIDNPRLESAFVAYETHKNYWHKADGKFVRFRQSDKRYLPRQLKDTVYREDTGLACATRSSIIKQGFRTGDSVEIIPHHNELVDIHTKEDIELLELKMRKMAGGLNA